MTEREIIRGCLKGKAKCQQELVNRYAPMLMTVSRRYARDYASAQDILQDAFVKIFRALGKFDEKKGAFGAWMRRIVINTALNALDKSCFKREMHVLDTMEESIQLSPDVYSQMGAEELMKIIGQLPDGYRQVFNLYVIEGYSHQEIADILKINESTSRSQLARARKMLQKQLTPSEKKIRV